MPVTYILDFADGTADQYDAVVERMQLGGKTPPGALFHCAGPTETGWRVMDVWESSDAFQSFAQEKIAPLSAEQGLNPPEIRRLEVGQLRRGADEKITFAQVIYIPDVTREMFTAMDAQVLGDAGFPPEGCVFHVNGPYEGGQYVMDAWTSEQARDDLIENRVKPAVQAAGMERRPTYEDLTVHNTLRHDAATGAAA
jgi:hypothetical protein